MNVASSSALRTKDRSALSGRWTPGVPTHFALHQSHPITNDHDSNPNPTPFTEAKTGARSTITARKAEEPCQGGFPRVRGP